MQYQSVIRLFEYCNVEYRDNIDVGRIKKILSAEFSIASGGIITINNFDYSKNDILEELESPDFSERLRCHQLIWEQPSLLNYLEQNIVYFSDVYKWVDLRKDADFVRFVSPYFATSFDKVMGKILNLPNFEDAKRWMNFLVFINNPEDEEVALNSLRIFLLETTKMLRNINSTTYVSFLKQIKPWAEQPSGSFLNKLPDSLYKIKEDLVRAWVNFTYGINQQNRTLCYEINSELIQVSGIDQELRDVILHNQGVFAGKKRGRGSGCGAFGFIPLIIIVIRFLISIGVSDSGSKHNYPKLDFPTTFQTYEKVTSDYFMELRDKYTTIQPTMFNDSNMNKNKRLSIGFLQYIMVERPDTCKSTIINIINNSSDCSLGVYVMTSEEQIMDFEIDKTNPLSIEVNKNTLDFAFSIINDKKPFPLIREWNTATLVSNFMALDMTFRTIKFDHTGRTLNIDNVSPSNKKGLTLEVYSTPELGPDSLTIYHYNNYMTFHNAEWCLIPK